MNRPTFDDLNAGNYADFNMTLINKWVADEQYWGAVTSHEDYVKAQNGDWGVTFMDETEILVPKEWFSPFMNNNRLEGVNLLGLAAGGGQQMPILQAFGATCTVMDYSDAQLHCEQLVAEREGYDINLVKADMTKTFPFEDNSFDVIFHPISNHFIEDVEHVWRECHRVLKPDGLLLAQVYNPCVYMFADYDEEQEDAQLIAKYKLPWNPLRDRALYESYVEPDDDENLTFSHSLEEQLGGQLKAGFVLTDLREERPKWGGLLGEYMPVAIYTRAVKATCGGAPRFAA
ncbi:MAG: class I SAM-dependent methyltransferase [Oscillospiraceae bacterium]|nr:class I SAM-dependent methyltransferase [Oscillospiraceae bacterium]